MRRLTLATGLLTVGVLMMAAVVAGQEKKDLPKAKGTLPANYGKIGLSDEQKTKVHEITADYKSQIDGLTRKIAELKTKQKKDLEAILTDSQKEQLRKLQTGEAGDSKPDAKKPVTAEKKSGEADKKPADNGKKTDDKPVEKKPTDK